MDTARTEAIERIARVISAQRLSINAKGDDPHAADAVDRDWANHRDDAIAILKTLREPDEAMAGVGDVATWSRMIATAIGDDDVNAATGGAPSYDPPAPGTDPLHEGP